MRIQVGQNCVIHSEVGKRVAKCHVCNQGIPKGTTRITITNFMGKWQKRSNGSRYNTFVKRFHPECLVREIQGGDDRGSALKCFQCQQPVLLPMNFTGGHTGGPLCSSCTSSGRWKFCNHCSHYWPTYQTSPGVIDGKPSGKFFCDQCSSNISVLTVKKQKQLRRIR